MTRLNWFVLLSLSLTTMGCVAFKRPLHLTSQQRPIPSAFLLSLDTDQTAAVDEWWTLFRDPRFTALVPAAGTDDQAILEARITASQAQLRRIGADRRPQIDLEGGVGRDSQNDLTIQSLRLGGNLTLSPDLFGRNLAQLGSARLQVNVSKMNQRATLVRVRAEAARLIIRHDRAARQAEAAYRTAKSLEATRQLVASRAGSGLAAKLDLDQADAEYEAAAARIPAFLQEAFAARRSLEALRGDAPGTLDDDLSQPLDYAAVGQASAAPSSVIANRPDVVAAAYLLEAAKLDAGAARAEAFPSLSLTAFLGQQEVSPSFVFNPSATITRLAANITVPLFQSGRLKANVDLADAKQSEAFYLWRQTGTSALSQVNIALSARLQAMEALGRAGLALDRATQAASRAEARWQAGLFSLTDYLLVQRTLFAAETTFVAAQAEAALTLVDLNEALGLGGKPFRSPAMNAPMKEAK